LNRLSKSCLAALLAFTILYLPGCDAGGGITIPSGASSLTVSVKSDDNIDAPVIITEAKALIANVEFEKQSDGRDQLHQPGPLVMNFSLNGTLKDMGTQYIIRDNYTKIKFQLHKPEENEIPPDAEFKDGTGVNQRYSFIIKGTYNGSAFVYKSKQAAAIIINFDKVTNIDLKTSNISVLFNKLKWFKNGTSDLNPNDPANESIIDNNIAASFIRAFRDDNKDGVPD
jgi:hypothetical protein